MDDHELSGVFEDGIVDRNRHVRVRVFTLDGQAHPSLDLLAEVQRIRIEVSWVNLGINLENSTLRETAQIVWIDVNLFEQRLVIVVPEWTKVGKFWDDALFGDLATDVGLHLDNVLPVSGSVTVLAWT